jgi:hypothetical protein
LSTPLYREPNVSVKDRVEHLLSLMTLDEKLTQHGLRYGPFGVLSHQNGTYRPSRGRAFAQATGVYPLA